MKLKPCPFCKAQPEIVTEMRGDHWHYHWVECHCGSRGPLFSDKRHAIQGWNKMARREPCN